MGSAGNGLLTHWSVLSAEMQHLAQSYADESIDYVPEQNINL